MVCVLLGPHDIAVCRITRGWLLAKEPSHEGSIRGLKRDIVGKYDYQLPVYTSIFTPWCRFAANGAPEQSPTDQGRGRFLVSESSFFFVLVKRIPLISFIYFAFMLGARR